MNVQQIVELVEAHPGLTIGEYKSRLKVWPTFLPSYSTVSYWLNKAWRHGKIRRWWAKWPTGCYARHAYWPLSSEKGEVYHDKT